MSKKLGAIGTVRRSRQRWMRIHRDYMASGRIHELEWHSRGQVFQIPLDHQRHLKQIFDREHYGDFVMPFETELNVEDFARDPSFDPFIGNPDFYNKRRMNRRELDA